MKKMADYVDRQAAMIEFAEHVKKSNNSDFAPTPTWNDAVEIVENLPSADVVEVVRCKDCVHYIPYDWMFSEVWKSQNIEDYSQDEIGCEWIDHYVKPDGYCSFGERKCGEDE